jgi:hypothetical protein
MPNAKGGQDPTRHEPGGSRTETKIAQESTLGSDRSGDAADLGPDDANDDGTGRQTTASSQGRGWAKRQQKRAPQEGGGS